MRHEDAMMNCQAQRPAIDESLSSLGITGDELLLLPGSRDVQLARARFLQDLHSRGLPTRLRARLKEPSRSLSTADAGDLAPLIPGSIVLRTNDASGDKRAGIEGISVRNYRDALT
jgi:hypothetical protein